MSSRKHITAEEVRELFDYHEDGRLSWCKSPMYAIPAGSIAGCLNRDGYFTVSIRQRKYLLHRLIFAWHYGYFPEYVDHRDIDSLNNRIDNLRDVTKSENCLNRIGANKNSSTLVRGVSLHIRSGRYIAKYRGGFYGYYDTIEEADKILREVRANV